MAIKYSVIVTSFECNGRGCEYLSQNLNMALQQSYRPLQIIVSDHSRNEEIEKMVTQIYCPQASSKNIELLYLRCQQNYGSPSANWNFAAKHATGDLWQYFAMDDYFSDSEAIKRVVAISIDRENDNWFACGHKVIPGEKTFIPRWNENILTRNTLSGPSAIVIRRNLHSVSFDPQFIWLLDLDWYYRLFVANNRTPPHIIDSPVWCNRIHENQLSNTVCDANRIESENKKLTEKYGWPLPKS